MRITISLWFTRPTTSCYNMCFALFLRSTVVWIACKHQSRPTFAFLIIVKICLCAKFGIGDIPQCELPYINEKWRHLNQKLYFFLTFLWDKFVNQYFFTRQHFSICFEKEGFCKTHALTVGIPFTCFK